MRPSTISIAITALLISALPALAQEKLTVYTYESFTAEWGPGPQVEKGFEAECRCDLEFVSAADGVALLNRVKLEGEGTKADIVLGLDTSLITEARETGLFAAHKMDTAGLTLPGGWSDDTFLPFDYGWFAVVYDTQAIQLPPVSLKDLIDGDPEQKIVIQDPRTSTPGLGLLLWVKAVYGNAAPKAWEKLRDRVLTVTPGWSEAYGLFTSGEAPMVLSYTTSPAYHMISEDSDRYQAASFSDGHYLQVEVAGLTNKGAANPLAAKFLAFMTGPQFQSIIPETNWMLPVAKTAEPLNLAFDRLVKPAKSLELAPDVIAANRKAWIDEWLGVMSR